MQAEVQTALVTTCRGATRTLDSFLRYHLAIGFDHIFLFVDHPDDPAVGIARRYSAVTVVPRDEKLLERWHATRLYCQRRKWIEAHVQREVMMRQMLNVSVAADMARERGIDWLVHIDADELFYSPDATVAEHFQALSEQEHDVVRYLNYEAVPQCTDVMDCFREVTLFKRSPAFFGARSFTDERRSVIDSLPNCPRSFFHFYTNGKAAGRVQLGLGPRGVHEFEIEPEGRNVIQQRLEKTRLAKYFRRKKWMPRLRRVLLEEPTVATLVLTNPAILHYSCCSFEAFWEKYRLLGHFDDKWFGSLPIPKGTHLDARDVVTQGDMRRAEIFYRDRFIMCEQQTARLLAAGLAVHLDGPSKVLASLCQEDVERLARPADRRGRGQDLMPNLA